MIWRKWIVVGLAVAVAVPTPVRAGLVPGPQLPPGYSIPPPGARFGYLGSYYGQPYSSSTYPYAYGYSSYYGGYSGYGAAVYVAPPPPVYVPPPPADPVPPAPPAAMPPPTPVVPPDPNTASITLNVPADCQVWIQGVKTTQVGLTRRFVSPKLEPGKDYHYDFRFTYAENGKETTRNEKIEVHAGDRKTFTVVANPIEAMPAPAAGNH